MCCLGAVGLHINSSRGYKNPRDAHAFVVAMRPASQLLQVVPRSAALPPPPQSAVRAGFALHPLTPDEEATCGSMVARERGARMTLMPTHHVGEFGDLTGFRFDCGPTASGGCLPVSRRMFYGHTLAECLDGEGAILRMMSEAGKNREVMRGFLERVERECEPALLDCIPDNSDAVPGPGRGLLQGMDLRTIDCKRWTPEVPELIGIYHAYLRGYNRDVRAHKMFIACSGGLEKASDAFCNLMIDAGKRWTAREVAESEEAWWLRKACHRSRCRLIKGVADAFGLKVPHIQDIQSHDPAVMAISCTDTLEHDMACTQDGVSVFNGCCDTTRPFNGILTRMHPAEGMWLFRGASRGSGFGTTFGDRRVCGAFPVTQPRVNRVSSVVAPWSDCLVRLKSPQPARMERYMCFDEAYFRTLERMQWDRDNGHMELMPIVVGMP